jgi:ribonuclease HI
MLAGLEFGGDTLKGTLSDRTEDAKITFPTERLVDFAFYDIITRMGKKQKKQYYIVVKGHAPGLYKTWFGDDGAAKQVENYPQALYKGFFTLEQATDWLRELGAEKLRTYAPNLLLHLENAPTEKDDPIQALLDAGRVVIYTDGSSLGNPGKGGYGAVLRNGDQVMELSAGYFETTNNRMEMMACIQALRTLKKHSDVVFFSDSKYIVDAVTKGTAARWRANRWLKSDRKKIANIDLWKELLQLCDEHEVEFRWVRGHFTDANNERCDQLANAAARSKNLKHDIGYADGNNQPSLF